MLVLVLYISLQLAVACGIDTGYGVALMSVIILLDPVSLPT
jgi:hypothetical protein